MVGTQAMVTSPRLALPVSRISVSAAARSVSSRRACGRKLSPGGVNATERVLRSTSRTPRKDSRFCRRRLSAVWVMLSSPAARQALVVRHRDESLHAEHVYFHEKNASIGQLISFYVRRASRPQCRHSQGDRHEHHHPRRLLRHAAGLPCFRKLDGHAVTVWNDHVQDTDALAERLRDTDALVLIRAHPDPGAVDRPAAAPEADQPAQRLSAYRHRRLYHAWRDRVLEPARRHAVLCRRRADLGLALAAMRQIPQQMKALQAGDWQIGVGRTLRAHPGHLRLWPDRRGKWRATARPSA